MQQAEKLLERFVNITSGDADRERTFLGSLRPGHQFMDGPGYVAIFRQSWNAVVHRKKGDPASERAVEAAERHLEGILAARGPAFASTDRPTIRVDLGGAGLAAHPRDMLDRLAIIFINARRRLAICTCGRYFIRAHSRDSSCSADCQSKARQESKNRWFKSPAGKRWLKQNRGRRAVEVSL